MLVRTMLFLLLLLLHCLLRDYFTTAQSPSARNCASFRSRRAVMRMGPACTTFGNARAKGPASDCNTVHSIMTLYGYAIYGCFPTQSFTFGCCVCSAPIADGRFFFRCQKKRQLTVRTVYFVCSLRQSSAPAAAAQAWWNFVFFFLLFF